MPTVFVVQEPLKRNRVSGDLEKVFDTTPALIYGKLETLFTNNSRVLAPHPTVLVAKKKLKDFSDEDFILAIGDPVAISIACCIAAEMNRGKYKVLKWARDVEQYVSIEINLSGRIQNQGELDNDHY